MAGASSQPPASEKVGLSLEGEDQAYNVPRVGVTAASAVTLNRQQPSYVIGRAKFELVTLRSKLVHTL
jgi:hypothetical protein